MHQNFFSIYKTAKCTPSYSLFSPFCWPLPMFKPKFPLFHLLLAGKKHIAYQSICRSQLTYLKYRISSAVGSTTGTAQSPLISSASSAASRISSEISVSSHSASASATGAQSSAHSVLSSLSATASATQTGSSNAANALGGGYSSTLLVQFAALAALFVASFVVMLA